MKVNVINALLSLVIAGGAICFLLPTALVYIFMMILVISGLVSDITDFDFEAVKTLLAASALFYCLAMAFMLFGGWFLCTGLYLHPA